MPGKPPDLWGPRLWFVLHGLARLHDATQDPRRKREQAAAMLRMMDLLQVTMPCGKCRASFRIFWRHNRALIKCASELPPSRGDYATAVAVYNLHNMVSLKLHKPWVPTFEETLADPVLTDASPQLWEYLFLMGYNLNDNGEDDKWTHYRAFLPVVIRVARAFGLPRTAAALERHAHQIASAATQDEWVDGLYWAYRAWSGRARSLSADSVRQAFGVCDRQ